MPFFVEMLNEQDFYNLSYRFFTELDCERRVSCEEVLVLTALLDTVELPKRLCYSTRTSHDRCPLPS